MLMLTKKEATAVLSKAACLIYLIFISNIRKSEVSPLRKALFNPAKFWCFFHAYCLLLVTITTEYKIVPSSPS